MDFPKYELVEIFECSRQSRLEHKKLRFLVTDGKKYFIMRPQIVNKNSMRLCCYNVNYRCKASLLLEFKADIRTEADVGSKHDLRRISADTSKQVLLSKSSYAIVTHQVKSQSTCFLNDFSMFGTVV